MSELEAVQEELVALWDRMAPYWAMTPAAARVQAWLLGHDCAADTDTIMAGLGMSRGAVSMGLRELREWGLVYTEKPPGSRRTEYRAETNLENLMRAIIEQRRRREWGPVRQHVEAWSGRLKSDRSTAARDLRERLEGFSRLMAFADSMAEAFLKGGTVKSFGLKLLLKRALGKR